MKNTTKKTSPFKTSRTSITSLGNQIQDYLSRFDNSDHINQLPTDSNNRISRESVDTKSEQNTSKFLNASKQILSQKNSKRKGKENKNYEESFLSLYDDYAKQRKIVKQKDQKYTFTFNQNFNQQFSKIQKSESSLISLKSTQYMAPMTIADDFFNSFRAILTTYIDLHFLKISLCINLKPHSTQIFKQLVALAQTQIFSEYQNVDINNISNSIGNLIQSYKQKDISQVIDLTFPYKLCLNACQFSKLFQFQNNKLHHSSKIAKQYHNKSPLQLFKMLFKVLIQKIDVKKKLKMICSANQNKFIQIIVSISERQSISMDKLSDFLYFDVKSSKKWHILRCKQFFQDIFQVNQSQVQFIKWIKTIK